MTPIRTLRPLAKVVLSTQSDERLVALSRQGSEDAFAEIVRRHRPGLVRLARSLGTADRADDVVQEGLVRAWRALQRNDAEIDLRPWLTTIVRNRALTAHSTNRPTEELDETIDGVRQPGDIVIMREELRSAVSAVNSLPDSQREALVRSALAGESHDQIATALATTPGAVRQLIFRARTGLREAMGALVPLPLVRALADIGTGGAAVGGSAAGGAAVAASAGGVGLKALAIVAVGATVAGSGIAIERHTSGADAKETDTTSSASSVPGQSGDSTTETAAHAAVVSGKSAAPDDGAPKSSAAVLTDPKASTASRSETLVADASNDAGTPRVPDGSGQSDGADASDSDPQTSDPPTQSAPQQPQQQPHQGGQQQPAPPVGQTGGQDGPPHQGDGQHQPAPYPPPPPPPQSGETAAADDGGYHHPVTDGGDQQPQPTDAHDGNHVGAYGLADLTFGD